MVIDEVQRVPQLLLAIKETVDADPRPGRFLLTGSARVMALRDVPDALPGRMETIELWPLSQGEIDGVPDGFIDAVFAHANVAPTTPAAAPDPDPRPAYGLHPDAAPAPAAPHRPPARTHLCGPWSR